MRFFNGTNAQTQAATRFDAGPIGVQAGTQIGPANATIFTPSSTNANFSGAGEGFAGPGIVFTPGVSPTLAELRLYFSDLATLTEPGGLGPADDGHAQKGGGPVSPDSYGSVEVTSP